MKTLKELMEILEKLRSVWYTWIGLIISLSIGPLLGLSFYTKISQVLTDLGLSKVNATWVFLMLLLLVDLSVFSVWFMKRSLPRFSESAVGIVIGIGSEEEEETKRVLTMVAKRLQSLIDEHDLRKEIKVRRLPPNQIPFTNAEAVRCRERSNATLVIWAQVLSGRIDGKTRIEFPSIKFTYRIRPITKEQMFKMSEDISISFLGRKWVVDEDNQIVDVQIISRNMLEICLHILGSSLLVSRKLDSASAVLSSLVAELEMTSKKPLSIERAAFLAKAKELLSRSQSLKILELKYNYGDRDNKEKGELVKRLAGQVISLDDLNPIPYISMSMFHFFNGNTVDAQIFAKDAIKRMKGQALPHLNIAFLEFDNGEFNKGLEQYRVAAKYLLPFESLFQVIEFIQDHLELHPEKIQFHFSLGFMQNAWLANDEIVIEELETFVRKADEQPDYKRLVHEARNILDKLRKAK